MKHIIFNTIIFTLAIMLSGCEQSNTPLEISHAWIREAPPNATAMAGYMKLANNTTDDIALVTAQSADFKVVEFHRSVEKDGVYRMVRHQQLIVPAKGTLELKPGDYHLMMITPLKPLVDGDHVELKLVTRDDAVVTQSIPVKKATFE